MLLNWKMVNMNKTSWNAMVIESMSRRNHELEFSYPDPSEPEASPAYREPLSAVVDRLEQDTVTTMLAVTEAYETSLRHSAANRTRSQR